MQEETPHFSTVSYNFRHRFTEETIDQVFRWILEEVAEAGCLSPKAVFVDGTHKLRPSTYKTSQGFLKNHIKPQISSIPLADLTSLDLQKFYKHLLESGQVNRTEAKKKPKGLAPKTVRNIHQMICSAYNLAMEQKLVNKNPAQGCALPKVEHSEMKTLTADQLGAFFREARETGVYELYYLDLATGLRRGELLGLKWSEVDFQHGTLKIQRAISRQNDKVTEAPLKTKTPTVPCLSRQMP